MKSLYDGPLRCYLQLYYKVAFTALVVHLQNIIMSSTLISFDDVVPSLPGLEVTARLLQSYFAVPQIVILVVKTY